MIKKFIVGAAVAVFAFVATTASVSAAYTHTSTLKMGMSSSQVMSLQQTLNMTACKVSVVGAGAPGMESMYFGAKTNAAVKCFQAMTPGLSVDGVVGPMTGAKLGLVVAVPAGNPNQPGCPAGAIYNYLTSAPCNTNSGGNTSGGGLNGTVGSLSFDNVSSYGNEEVGEGEEDAKVAGLELDAEDSDSDVRITSIKINFDPSTSTDFEDVADEVTVWLGSTKVGSIDAEEFDDDNDFEKVVSLSGAVVRMDDTENLVIAVTGDDSIDTGDLNDAWTVDITQVRYVDAQGATTTEDASGVGFDAETFTFQSFATANDVELVVALNNDEDDINDAHTITVDEDDETDSASILAFTLEAEGDSDITVNELSVLLTTNDTIDGVVESVDLYHGTTKLGSEDADGSGTTDTVTFDDLDVTVDAGDEEEFTVKVNLFNTDDYTDGSTTIMATIGATQVDAIDAEDESGEELGSGELTGTANGEAHTLSTTEATVDVTSKESDQNDAGTVGTFTFNVTITAEGGDVDVDAASIVETLLEPAANTQSLTLSIANLDGDAVEVTPGSDYTVEDGESNTFAISYTLNPDANGMYYVRLDSIDGVTVDETTPGESLSA